MGSTLVAWALVFGFDLGVRVLLLALDLGVRALVLALDLGVRAGCWLYI